MIQWGMVGYFTGEPLDVPSFVAGLALGLLIGAVILVIVAIHSGKIK